MWLISVLVDFTAASTQRWMVNIGGGGGLHGSLRGIAWPHASPKRDVWNHEKGRWNKTPKRDRAHTHRCSYAHANTHPHNRLHTKCAFWTKWGEKYSSVTFHWGWKDTDRQLFFLSFLFLNGAFSGQLVIGLEVKQVKLFFRRVLALTVACVNKC